MDEFDSINKIHLVTIERGNEQFHDVQLDFKKVTHHPIHTKYSFSFFLSKMDEFGRIPNTLTKMARSFKVDMIFAKASFAGALAYLVHRRTNLPFMVESFEPHSDYMVECGEWKKNGFLFKYAKYYEQKQLNFAKYIITVTNNYKKYLKEQEYVPEDKIKVIPSITPIEQFSFNMADRARIRNKYNIGNEIVGVYVGKFGGLYYDEQAYDIFKSTYDHFRGKMKFFILSPEPPEQVISKMTSRGIPNSSINTLLATHNDVPQFLSASDIAFSTIKPAFSKQFQCPVKNGEYWANGLPILMTHGIADDYKLMEKGLGGALFDLSKDNLTDALKNIEEILNSPDHRNEIRKLAVRYKSLDLARNVYCDIF